MPPVVGPTPPVSANPALAAAKPNLGGATAPQANQGNAMAALGKIKVAIQAMQDALPSIPMGSPLHTDVLKCAQSLSKHMDQQQQQEGVPVQALAQMAQQAKQAQPMNALARMGAQQPPTSPAMPGAGAPPAAAAA